jgi:hypothetical protein
MLADAPGTHHVQHRSQVQSQGGRILREDAALDGPDPAASASRENDRFTSTEVVYGVTGTDVTDMPEYGVSA